MRLFGSPPHDSPGLYASTQTMSRGISQFLKPWLFVFWALPELAAGLSRRVVRSVSDPAPRREQVVTDIVVFSDVLSIPSRTSLCWIGFILSPKDVPLEHDPNQADRARAMVRSQAKG